MKQTINELSKSFFKLPILTLFFLIFAISFILIYLFVFFGLNMLVGPNVIPNNVILATTLGITAFVSFFCSAMIYNGRQYIAFADQFNVLYSNVDKYSTAEQLIDLRGKFIQLYKKYMGVFGAHHKIDACIMLIDARLVFEFKIKDHKRDYAIYYKK